MGEHGLTGLMPRGLLSRWRLALCLSNEVRDALRVVLDFTEEEGERLREKILHTGGLEPGRVRRG